MKTFNLIEAETVREQCRQALEEQLLRRIKKRTTLIYQQCRRTLSILTTVCKGTTSHRTTRCRKTNCTFHTSQIQRSIQLKRWSKLSLWILIISHQPLFKGKYKISSNKLIDNRPSSKVLRLSSKHLTHSVRPYSSLNQEYYRMRVYRHRIYSRLTRLRRQHKSYFKIWIRFN